MQAEQPPFTIINAAAGSGKTYTLVFRYLVDLLGAPHPEGFKEMLAITFTNKAVYEMKHRIITTLATLSKQPDAATMAPALQEALSLSKEALQQRARLTLTHLLQDYGAFDVITIDRFNHRLIRTFAFDLKLPYGFEVVVQSEEFLNILIDRIIAAVGENAMLTKILVAYSRAKIADDKSWDVGIDLLDTVPLLMNENDRLPLQTLKKLTLNDLDQLQSTLHQFLNRTLDTLRTLGTQTIALLQSAGITAEDFPRQTLFNHFLKLQEFEYEHLAKAQQQLYTNQLGQQLATDQPFYKTLEEAKIANIEALRESLAQAHTQGKNLVFLAHQYKSLLQQLTPLALLGQMEQQLEELQLEQNKMLLGRFNERIAKVVAQQPAPFIYERLGEKYLHYYMDEFQDTSVLQWNNLVPLVANALEGLKSGERTGKILLVGDPKQAIYRWRGGDVQQFLSLLQKNSPFQFAPEVVELKSNYRSAPEIVTFNNALFAFLGTQLEDKQQRNLFLKSAQQHPEKKELKGGIQLHFISNHSTKEARAKDYLAVVLKQIQHAKAQGFTWGEMAILTRQKEEAQQIAQLLTQEEIPAISSEALLLSASEKVQALIGLMQLSLQADNDLARKSFFHVLWAIYAPERPYFDFLFPFVQQPLLKAFQQFNTAYKTTFDWVHFLSSSPYEAIEYCLSSFQLPWKKDPYVQFFLDELHQFVQSKEASFDRFLMYWERQKNQLSLEVSEGLDAIQIMTIHKAKGLEFSVVFVPFLEQNFQSKQAKVWIPLEEKLHPLTWGQFPVSQQLQHYPEPIPKAYQKAVEAAVFDAANVLYVACTRAVQRLYLSTHKTDATATSNYAGLLNQFCSSKGLSVTADSFHEWGFLGARTRRAEEDVSEVETVHFELVSNLNWRSRLLLQLSYPPSEAQHYGILIHEILKNIRFKEDAPAVLKQAEKSGQLSASERKHLKSCLDQLFEHPDIAIAFDESNKIWIEQDILLPEGEVIRPDRFAATEDGIVLIDFKTGQPKKEHSEQIQRYAKALGFMNKPIVKRCLVYLNATVEVLEVA